MASSTLEPDDRVPFLPLLYSFFLECIEARRSFSERRSGAIRMEHLLLKSDADYYRWRCAIRLATQPPILAWEALSHEWNSQVDPKLDGFARMPKLRAENNCRKLTGRMGHQGSYGQPMIQILWRRYLKR